MEEQHKKILEKITTKYKSLKINRIPEKTRDAFIKLADEDFCSDYGMLIKWLMDGLVSADTKMLISMIESNLQEINNLKEEIATIKIEQNQTPIKEIKLLNGKRIGGK